MAVDGSFKSVPGTRNIETEALTLSNRRMARSQRDATIRAVAVETGENYASCANPNRGGETGQKIRVKIPIQVKRQALDAQKITNLANRKLRCRASMTASALGMTSLPKSWDVIFHWVSLSSEGEQSWFHLSEKLAHSIFI